MAMIETKKVLAAEHKEDKMARWNELKAFENEKWKTKLADGERKLKAEERRLALEEERICDAKKDKECAIMFINPNTMDETERKYWELTRGEILASLRNVGGGRGGGDGSHGGGGGHGGDGGRGGVMVVMVVVVVVMVVMVMVAERMVIMAKRVVVVMVVAERMSRLISLPRTSFDWWWPRG